MWQGGLRSAPGVPPTGWRRRGRIDLGEANQVCEWCGIQCIRCVNVMTHPDWPHGPVGAGNDCAEDMSGEGVLGWRMRELRWLFREHVLMPLGRHSRRRP
jgi:hypothetical protein